jgi:diguanylate cyclase (GGDEF)-like protein/PAS domain S-box-containing protein
VTLSAPDVTAAGPANDTSQRLAAVVRSSSDAIFAKTLDGTVLEWNPAAVRLFGWSPDEIVGRSIALILPPDRADELARIMERIRHGELVEPLETVRIRKDGRAVDVSLTVSPIRDSSGRVVGASTISRDITLQKAAERALRDSEERFRLSFENAPIGIALVSTDGRFLRVNRVLCDMVGRSELDLLEMSFQEITHPEDLDADLGFVRQMLAGEIRTYSMEKRYIHADGHPVWVQLSVSLARNDAGTPLHFISQIADIGSSRRAEQRFAALVESAPDAMVIVGPDGRLLLVNRQTELLFGYRREELIGQPVEMLLPDAVGGRHQEHRAAYFRDPRPRPMGSGMELYARRSDGTQVPVEISLGPLHTDEGTVVSAAIRDITGRKKADAALAHAALHDALTDLPNRVLLADRLEQALVRSSRSGHPVAVLFLDLDRFKLINDSLGHAAGDQVILTATERLLATVRSGDTVARFGGDEFVVIAEQHEGGLPAAGLAARINAVLRDPFTVEGSEVFLSASIGIALGTGGHATADGLLRDADAAMYRAKERGRARVEFFDEAMRVEAAGRLETQNALHRALDRGELRLFYQPVVELASERVVGVEALLRWEHPQRGLLAPRSFIPLAEEAGLIVPIGQWLIEEAARACAHWRSQGLFVSVNLSARQLRQPDLFGVVAGAVRANALPSGALRLELTESLLMEDLELHGRALTALRDLGVTLAIDDFGTGYSSLTYLRRFPVKVVKIDRSFVAGLGRNLADSAIVDSVIKLAHALDLEVVGEGTETAEQVACLRDLGCDKAQGFYFAPPGPSEAIDVLLASGRPRLRSGGQVSPPQLLTSRSSP